MLNQHHDLLQRFVLEHSAETMQAVPTMLELVPRGVNKGSGMRKLLADLELPAEVGVPATHRAAAAMDRQQQDSADDCGSFVLIVTNGLQPDSCIIRQ